MQHLTDCEKHFIHSSCRQDLHPLRRDAPRHENLHEFSNCLHTTVRQGLVLVLLGLLWGGQVSCDSVHTGPTSDICRWLTVKLHRSFTRFSTHQEVDRGTALAWSRSCINPNVSVSVSLSSLLFLFKAGILWCQKRKGYILVWRCWL